MTDTIKNDWCEAERVAALVLLHIWALAMTFYVTRARRLRVVRAGACAVLAITVGVLPFAAGFDMAGRIGCLTLAGFFGVMVFVNLWWASRTDPTATVIAIPDLAPVPEQIRFYGKMLLFTAIGFPIGTAWLVYDLHKLETGAVKDVEIWLPLVSIYERFGFWPTVLAEASLGVLCAIVFTYKLRTLAARQAPEEAVMTNDQD